MLENTIQSSRVLLHLSTIETYTRRIRSELEVFNRKFDLQIQRDEIDRQTTSRATSEIFTRIENMNQLASNDIVANELNASNLIDQIVVSPLIFGNREKSFIDSAALFNRTIMRPTLIMYEPTQISELMSELASIEMNNELNSAVQTARQHLQSMLVSRNVLVSLVISGARGENSNPRL